MDHNHTEDVFVDLPVIIAYEAFFDLFLNIEFFLIFNLPYLLLLLEIVIKIK